MNHHAVLTFEAWIGRSADDYMIYQFDQTYYFNIPVYEKLEGKSIWNFASFFTSFDIPINGEN